MKLDYKAMTPPSFFACQLANKIKFVFQEKRSDILTASVNKEEIAKKAPIFLHNKASIPLKRGRKNQCGRMVELNLTSTEFLISPPNYHEIRDFAGD